MGHIIVKHFCFSFMNFYENLNETCREDSLDVNLWLLNLAAGDMHHFNECSAFNRFRSD